MLLWVSILVQNFNLKWMPQSLIILLWDCVWVVCGIWNNNTVLVIWRTDCSYEFRTFFWFLTINIFWYINIRLWHVLYSLKLELSTYLHWSNESHTFWIVFRNYKKSIKKSECKVICMYVWWLLLGSVFQILDCSQFYWGFRVCQCHNIKIVKITNCLTECTLNSCSDTG